MDGAWSLLAAAWEAALAEARLAGRLDLPRLAGLEARREALAEAERGAREEARGLDLLLFVVLAEQLPPLAQAPGRPRLELVPRLPAGPRPAPPGPAWRQLAPGHWVGEAPGGLADIGLWAARLARTGHLWRRARRLARRAGLTAGLAPPHFAAYAAAWRLAPEALAQAAARHPEALDLLARPWRWPEVAIDPACAPALTGDPHSEAAEAPLAWLSAAGLASRPLHLWFGPSLVPRCLSPLTRDLAGELAAWATSRPAELDAHLYTPGHLHPEDWLYALAEGLTRARPDLVGEHRAAALGVGVSDLLLDQGAAWACDLGRLAPPRADTRLAGATPAPGGPVVLVVDTPCPDAPREILERLLAAPQVQVASVTVVQAALAPHPPSHSLLLPRLAFALGAGRAHALPQTGLGPEDLAAEGAAGAAWGADLLVPPWGTSAAQARAMWPARLGPPPPLAARDAGAGAASWLADAHLTGRLPAGLAVTIATWPGTLPRPGELGAPATVGLLPALSALSLALLRRILPGAARGAPPAPAGGRPPPGRGRELARGVPLRV